MNAWNSVIYMKSNKSLNEMKEMSSWKEIDSMWSTSGDWDWCVKLDSDNSTPEKAEAFTTRLRSGNWVSDTRTNWWREIAAQ